MGPLSWLAQLPILASVPSAAGLAGQAATGMGVLTLGGAVGFGPLVVLEATAAGDPHGPTSGAPVAGDPAATADGGADGQGRSERARGRVLTEDAGGRRADRPDGPAPAAHGQGANGAQGPGSTKDGGRPSPKPPEATSTLTAGKTLPPILPTAMSPTLVVAPTAVPTVAVPPETIKHGSAGSTR